MKFTGLFGKLDDAAAGAIPAKKLIERFMAKPRTSSSRITIVADVSTHEHRKWFLHGALFSSTPKDIYDQASLQAARTLLSILDKRHAGLANATIVLVLSDFGFRRRGKVVRRVTDHNLAWARRHLASKTKVVDGKIESRSSKVRLAAAGCQLPRLLPSTFHLPSPF